MRSNINIYVNTGKRTKGRWYNLTFRVSRTSDTPETVKRVTDHVFPSFSE